MTIHFRKPPMMLYLPLSKPINDGLRDPRTKQLADFVDNTMPMRDWKAYDAPAKLRMKKRKPSVVRALPVLLMRQAG